MTYNGQIIKRIKERLEHGKKEYPDDLNVHDGRNWLKETVEELLDSLVYITAFAIQLEETATRKKDPHRFSCVKCGSGFARAKKHDGSASELCLICWRKIYESNEKQE